MGIHFLSEIARNILIIKLSRSAEIFTLSTLATMVSALADIVLFVCFVALRPKSTAMVMAGWSVDLPTLFPGQA